MAISLGIYPIFRQTHVQHCAPKAHRVVDLQVKGIFVDHATASACSSGIFANSAFQFVAAELAASII